LGVTSSPSFDDLQAIDKKVLSGRGYIQGIEPYLNGTTSLAVTSYQFFTGKIPSLEGLNYLVIPGYNSNSLNSSYYTDFSLENRYINFASNLGLHGEGAQKFLADYGALSFHDAIVKAYAQIVGGPSATVNPSAAIASIEASQPYFAQVAQERMSGDDQALATKAAAIGYIMEEAVRANVGTYAHALENFYLDLADGTAKTLVDLVGVYGVGTFIDLTS
jgi:serralysin